MCSHFPLATLLTKYLSSSLVGNVCHVSLLGETGTTTRAVHLFSLPHLPPPLSAAALSVLALKISNNAAHVCDGLNDAVVSTGSFKKHYDICSSHRRG